MFGGIYFGQMYRGGVLVISKILMLRMESSIIRSVKLDSFIEGEVT